MCASRRRMDDTNRPPLASPRDDEDRSAFLTLTDRGKHKGNPRELFLVPLLSTRAAMVQEF